MRNTLRGWQAENAIAKCLHNHSGDSRLSENMVRCDWMCHFEHVSGTTKTTHSSSSPPTADLNRPFMHTHCNTSSPGRRSHRCIHVLCEVPIYIPEHLCVHLYSEGIQEVSRFLLRSICKHNCSTRHRLTTVIDSLQHHSAWSKILSQAAHHRYHEQGKHSSTLPSYAPHSSYLLLFLSLPHLSTAAYSHHARPRSSHLSDFLRTKRTRPQARRPLEKQKADPSGQASGHTLWPQDLLPGLSNP